MTDVRCDRLTGDWVIIAPGRATRPHGQTPAPAPTTRPRWDEACPFCPGNEHRTPPEVDRALLAGSPERWQVRVFPNPHPIAQADPAETGSDADPARHEVIVDTPDHAETLCDLRDEAIRLLFEAYSRRWHALQGGPGTQAVVIFHNEGIQAGASVQHSHTQAVALPRLPPLWERAAERARAAGHDASDSIAASLLASEQASGERIITERHSFVAYHPFASGWPFETCIQPEGNVPDFASTTLAQRHGLALLTRDVLRALRDVLGQAPYNLLLDAPPSALEHSGLLRWRVRILPRLVQTGGFELATQARVNPVAPEEACRRTRAALAAGTV